MCVCVCVFYSPIIQSRLSRSERAREKKRKQRGRERESPYTTNHLLLLILLHLLLTRNPPRDTQFCFSRRGGERGCENIHTNQRTCTETDTIDDNPSFSSSSPLFSLPFLLLPFYYMFTHEVVMCLKKERLCFFVVVVCVYVCVCVCVCVLPFPFPSFSMQTINRRERRDADNEASAHTCVCVCMYVCVCV